MKAPAPDTTMDLTKQEPMPAAGVEAALRLMACGKLHRYSETSGVPSEESQLERWAVQHTPGAADRRMRTHDGRSLQSNKHVNAGEGGLLVCDDEDLAAQAVLMSGSYMLYRSHLARPDDAVFERWKYKTPNFSLRMGKLPAALARPQLGAVLRKRCERSNQRRRWLAAAISDTAHSNVPARHAREQFVASSLQFSVVDLDPVRIAALVAACAAGGVHVKWFGADAPAGFTSAWSHWHFMGVTPQLHNAARVLGGLCDLRLPLTLSHEDCLAIAKTLHAAMAQTQGLDV